MAELRAARSPGKGLEAAVVARWAAGARGPLRLEDGRMLRVIFPGVPGGGAGPDFRDALLDAGGDYLRGDVEVHTLASGWRAHGHHLDEAYGRVVLHVVAENDTGAATTLHRSGRAIAIAALGPPPREAAPLPGFVPPCALAVAQGMQTGAALTRLGQQRMRMKAARAAPLAGEAGAGQALYTLLLETLGGPVNRAPFRTLAHTLPLAALVERVPGNAAERAGLLGAELQDAARALDLSAGGTRPAAAPGVRLEAAGRLVDRLWPEGVARAAWPAALEAEAFVPRVLAVAGIGRGMAVELAVNAVLPVALASGAWAEADAERCLGRLPSPGTYGKLRRLEGWLGGKAALECANTLQGALLLHADYCTQGRCGRCPLSS